MKKAFLLLTLSTILFADIPSKSALNESANQEIMDVSDAPFRERNQDLNQSNKRKAITAMIGTIAAVTIGLLVSGADTGKKISSLKESES